MKKKLIEVALPLEAINKASAREKSIRHGHPSTLHLWWARRPLAAARAVIFAQMVDDPSAHPDQFPTEEAQEKNVSGSSDSSKSWCSGRTPRTRRCLHQARDEIWKSWRATCAENKDHPRAAELFNPDKLPAFHDPFAGGGSLPLEAQRLGLEAYASDLNPVAVLINKAMIEIPPKFAGKTAGESRGAQGQGTLQKEVAGRARTGRGRALLRPVDADEAKSASAISTQDRDHCRDGEGTAGPEAAVGQKTHGDCLALGAHGEEPNPAFAQVDVPLASTFMLSTKPGKEAYVEPVIEVAATASR